jgi:hypothetical protein
MFVAAVFHESFDSRGRSSPKIREAANRGIGFFSSGRGLDREEDDGHDSIQHPFVYSDPNFL